MVPDDTDRLRFREMTPADLEVMADMLGDPQVMAYYPAPKSREEAAGWIAWNLANYVRDGYGLWILETHDGGFVGDCGLTWQTVNGRRELEVGYHVRSDLQGRGFAKEAAQACVDFARDVARVEGLVAIIHPDNIASRRVAEHIGMTHLEEDVDGSIVRIVMGIELNAVAS